MLFQTISARRCFIFSHNIAATDKKQVIYFVYTQSKYQIEIQLSKNQIPSASSDPFSF